MGEVRKENRGQADEGVLDGRELWGRLRAATNTANSLAATNRQLAGRVAALERQLAEAGALSDDELVAELPRRMARALESAQEVAEEVVGRAKMREGVIRRRTDDRVAALITQAEAEATAILRRAAEEAVGRVNQAKAQAQSIVRAAQAEQGRIYDELREQSARVEEQIAALRNNHGLLVQAYGVVERTLAEAKGALRAASEMAAAPHDSRDGDRERSAPPGQLYALPHAASRRLAQPAPEARTP